MDIVELAAVPAGQPYHKATAQIGFDGPETTYVLSVVMNPLYKPSEATEKYISYVKRAVSALGT